MNRRIGLGDWRTTAKVSRLASKLGVHVLHGHGAKGGAYARLAGRKLKRQGTNVKAIYTPHGGSLHYSPASLWGSALYHGRAHAPAPDRRDDLRKRLRGQQICRAHRSAAMPRAHHLNGLYRHEFYEPMLADDAVDFVYIGELRHLKGVDVLLEALAAHQTIFPGRALIVGSGSDERKLQAACPQAWLGFEGLVRGAATGAHRLCSRPLCRGAFAGGIASLYRARSRRGADADDRDQCRRHSGDRRRASTCRSFRPATSARLPANCGRFSQARSHISSARPLLQKRIAEQFSVENMTHEGHRLLHFGYRRGP